MWTTQSVIILHAWSKRYSCHLNYKKQMKQIFSISINTIFQPNISDKFLFWCLRLLPNSDILFETRLPPLEIVITNVSIEHNWKSWFLGLLRSTPPEVFLGKDVLKICSKFTGDHSCRSMISIKLLCKFKFQNCF